MSREGLVDAIRVEAWDEGGFRTVLAMSARGRTCMAGLLRVGAGGASWEHAEAFFPRGALRKPRGAVAGAMRTRPAGRKEALRFLCPGNAFWHAVRLTGFRRGTMPDLPPGRPGTPVVQPWDMPELWAPVPMSLAGGDPGPGSPARPEELPTPPGPRRPETPPVAIHPPSRLPHAQAGLFTMAEVGRLLEKAGEGIWLHAGTALRDAVGLGAWDPELHARHADPDLGLRRLQATALHPWAAGIVAGDAGLSALVDAGLPFEAALAEAASRLTVGLARKPLDARALRRMRGQARPDVEGDLARMLEAVSRLGDAPGPCEVRALARADHACSLFLARLSLPDTGALLRSLPPAARGTGDGRPGAEDAFKEAWEALADARDMLDACAETLALPLLGHPEGLDPARAAGACARLVAPGLGFRALAAASRRWHAGHAAYRARLPGLADEVRWPEAFAPMSLAGGVTARCLTSQSELSDEGAEGPDSEGREGLGHCVGGYARACAEGGTHVVSLRDATGARLATVELRRGVDGTPCVVQARGRNNASPPPAAKAVLAELGRRLAEARLPSARAVALPRPTEPALAAWGPFLPSGLRTAERILAALKEALADGAAAGSVEPPSAAGR